MNHLRSFSPVIVALPSLSDFAAFEKIRPDMKPKAANAAAKDAADGSSIIIVHHLRAAARTIAVIVVEQQLPAADAAYGQLFDARLVRRHYLPARALDPWLYEVGEFLEPRPRMRAF